MQFTVNYFRRGVRCAVVKFRFIKNVHSYQTTGVYNMMEYTTTVSFSWDLALQIFMQKEQQAVLRVETDLQVSPYMLPAIRQKEVLVNIQIIKAILPEVVMLKCTSAVVM